MLKPAYLEKLPNNLIEVYAQAEEDIIADMARRIAAYDYFIPSAEHQFRKIKEMGVSYDDIINRLSANTRKSKQEIERLIKEAGAETLKTDKKIYEKAGLNPKPLEVSPSLKATLTQGIKRTNNTFANLTRTTARTGSKQFSDALDRAFMQVSSGAFSPDVAIKRTIKELSSQGLMTVSYTSGRKVNIESAVRTAVTTGVNQNALEVQLAYMDDMNCDLVETTAHAGSRPEHALWQGKVFSRSGIHPKYQSLREGTGYGTGAGLGGWNCRHSIFPFFEGISELAHTRKELEEYNKPKYPYDGKLLTEYEAVSQQRYFERQIRRWKREYVAMKAAGMEVTESAGKIAKWQSVQRDFTRQTGLTRQYDREQIGKVVAESVKKEYNKDVKVGKNAFKSKYDIALNRVLEHGKRTNTESLMWLDLKGNEILPFATGDKTSVAISREDINYLKSLKNNTVISLHNHPGSSSFSPQDMNIGCILKSVKEMRVIGHDGTKYFLSIGDGQRPEGYIIEDMYYKIKKDLSAKYYKMFDEINDSQKIWKEHSNEINEKIAKHFGWQYRREL